MKQTRLNLKLLFAITLVIAISIPAQHSVAAVHAGSTARASNSTANSHTLVGDPGFTACTLYRSDDGVSCRTAEANETAMTTQRDPNQPLEVISPVQLTAQGGLTIVLRATPELDAFPKAKNAFLRAAATWQSLIQTPIKVVVDVDFGSTWFGNPYPDGVLGLTSPQMLQGPEIYTALKQSLYEGASSAPEKQTYLKLPDLTCPTDLGDTTLVYAPSSVFRAIGLIDPDPANDPANFGAAPAVGFNSAFPYDFDPSDGIDAGKVDFDAVVTHELGHVLGFSSAAAQKELDPTRALGVTVWDLFRFRPGVSMSTFDSAQRVLSSGGFQVYYKGDDDLQLSTGRPDFSGGDGRQASHWKDDALTGQRIGIMDPTLPSGKRAAITMRDLGAIDSFGYTLAPFGNNVPSINELSADLNGDVLSLSGKLTDLDGDVVQAQIQLLDVKGHVVGSSSPFAVDVGVTQIFFFNLQVTGASSSPIAMQAELVFIDSHGNRSAGVDADFSGGDDGGPKLKSASFNDDVLKVKGKRMKGQLQVEINGQALPASIALDVNSSGKKMTISGASGALNLRTGPNRLRVISDGLRSNLFVVNVSS
ncbi:MAG TPA: NF038122 family metalloprotease [Blastocatellia bacterium]|nr:NF038122 family metalloprotease [Blastocatellia bacterium]